MQRIALDPLHHPGVGPTSAARAGQAQAGSRARSAPAGSARAAASGDRAGRTRADPARNIINTALLLELLSATLYYTALTTPVVMRTPQLGGGSSDPNNPGLPPNGNPQQVRYLQAALDAELKHADLLVAAGATAPATRFHFPAATFTRLGSALEPDSFLFLVDQVETASVGLYVAAVNELIGLGRVALAQLAAEMAGVESEHRMLGRTIAAIRPANNLTLAPEPFASVSEVEPLLRPYLTGRGFPRGATRALALPTRAQAARVIGKYGTHRVFKFL